MKRRCCILLASVLAVTAPLANAVENVILFVGDGMGFEHIKAARAYVNGDTGTLLTFEALGFAGQSITKLPGGGITDSATAGTALATGYQHPANGVIGMGGNNSIKSNLVELAKAKLKSTGIITTDEIGGATPGAFGAHEPDRTLTAAIRADFLRNDVAQGHFASRPDILFGGGFDDPSTLPGTTLNFVDLAQANGYAFVSTVDQLNQPLSRPVIGLFGSSWAPMTTMAARQSNSPQPTLSQMVSRALDLLQGGGGFFLIVESANIDKLSHSNDETFVAEIAELNAAVQVVLEWAKTPERRFDDTIVFVTADHETGGLSVPDQRIEPGTLPAMTWSSTGHTAANVPLFANWPPVVDEAVLENEETFFLVQDTLTRNGTPPVATGLVVTAITENSATVQWSTFELAVSEVVLTVGNQSKSFYGSGRSNNHTIVCNGLAPGTTFLVTAKSTDLSGFTGTEQTSFATLGGDLNAYVSSEPVVSLGTMSGTYQATRVADSVKQSFAEASDGVGQGIAIDYTLHTPAQVGQIDSLRIQASASWTGLDGAADGVIALIKVLGPNNTYAWEQIPAFPFEAVPAASYVDASGNIIIRFEDTGSVRREKRDTFAVDYLVGTVLVSEVAPITPARPSAAATAVESPLSVKVTWSASQYHTGYQIWRRPANGNWTLLAEPSAATVEFSDANVASQTSYEYVVRAFNTETFSDSAPAGTTTPLVLLAPVAKVALAKTGVAVSWTDPNTAESNYEVLRATSAAGPFTVLATLAANTVKYTDKAVVRGITYYYAVRALKDGVHGTASAVVSLKY